MCLSPQSELAPDGLSDSPCTWLRADKRPVTRSGLAAPRICWRSQEWTGMVVVLSPCDLTLIPGTQQLSSPEGTLSTLTGVRDHSWSTCPISSASQTSKWGPKPAQRFTWCICQLVAVLSAWQWLPILPFHGQAPDPPPQQLYPCPGLTLPSPDFRLQPYMVNFIVSMWRVLGMRLTF
jgi:hypothetical protein